MAAAARASFLQKTGGTLSMTGFRIKGIDLHLSAA